MTLGTDSNLEKILMKMMKKIEDKPIIPIDYQLWDLDDIAKYLKYSTDYTKRHIITSPNFPPSRDLPTAGDHTVPRWKAKDIINYAMAFDKRMVNYT